MTFIAKLAAICLCVTVSISGAMAQDDDSYEPLPDDLKILLTAAAQSENPDDIADAIRLLDLTQDATSIYMAASELGHAHTAIEVLGNPVRFVPEPEFVLPIEEPETPSEATEEPAQLIEAPVAILDGPAALVSTLANGESDLWTGRVRLGARFDTGNTDRSDYHAGLEVERALAGWGYEAKFNYAYSRTNGTIGRDHFEVDMRGEREVGERFTAFVNGNYDQDARSGFDWTAFVGAGLGYRVIEEDHTSLVLRASPGARFINPVGLEQETLAAIELMSDFNTDISESLSFESETHFLFTEQSRADQRFKLVTDLGELWALEFRIHYRYEFDPEPGFNNEDTRTDISITREF